VASAPHQRGALHDAPVTIAAIAGAHPGAELAARGGAR
jgi:hypothetical protein